MPIVHISDPHHGPLGDVFKLYIPSSIFTCTTGLLTLKIPYMHTYSVFSHAIQGFQTIHNPSRLLLSQVVYEVIIDYCSICSSGILSLW